MPPLVETRLTPLLEKIGPVVGDFLHASGEALRARNLPPAIDAVQAAFKAHAAAFDDVRHEGLPRIMTSEAAERFFALGFALEQMREHLSEVHRVVGEWASD